MKKYFIKTDTGQEGPFDLQQLKGMGVTAGTHIRSEEQEEWMAAGEADDLKELFAVPPVAAQEIDTETAAAVETAPAVGEVETAAKTTAEAGAAVSATVPPGPAAPVVQAARKTGSAVIGWVLSVLAIAGTGYYVYQDMEKNKNPSAADTTAITDTVSTQDLTSNQPADTTATVTTGMPVSDTITAVTTEPVATEPPTTSVTTTNKTPAAKDPAAIKKAEDEKKKLLAAQAKKKEEEKKKLAAAAAARETALRNSWARYVTLGSYKIEGDDKVKPFSIPVNNGYSVPLDKVTLRVDYLKKEKLVASETLVLYNIGSNGSQSVQATGNKKGHTANVYITGINSSQLHFCYPVHNGNPADPFYCK